MSQYDIVFDSPNSPQTYDIIFNNNRLQLPKTTGVINAGLNGLNTSLKGIVTRYVYTGKLQVQVNADFLNAQLNGYYNVNNPFEWLTKPCGNFQEAISLPKLVVGVFRESLDAYAECISNFEQAVPLQKETTTTLESALVLAESYLNNFQRTEIVPPKIISSNAQESVRLATKISSNLQNAIKVNLYTYKSNLQNAENVLSLKNSNYQNSLPLGISRNRDFKKASPFFRETTGNFELAEELGNPKSSIKITPPVIQPKQINDIVFTCLAKDWENNPYDYTIIFNDTCELKFSQPTDFSEPIFVKNTFSLKNLETGQEIKVLDISFSTDQDSYSWTGSMTLPDNQIEFLKSPTNKPVLVEYVFNDIKAVFQVGKISRNISFGQRSYKVNLSSPSVKFDEPTSPLVSYTNTQPITPSAYAEKLLDVVNSGIALQWDFLPPLDWVISAGAFTYQNLPTIKAIGAMLENSGAFLNTSLDGKYVTVKRRRPFVFWETPSADKVITIPKGVITSLGYEIEHLQHFNSVYVLANDRTVFVKRRDTNGATLAPQVVAKQLTSNQACMEAGRYILANAGIVETHDLVKPILNDGVLLNPADIVKFTLDNTTYIGTVISTSVAIKFNSQYQTFKVEVVKGFN